MERRRAPRLHGLPAERLRLKYEDAAGFAAETDVTALDYSETGIRVQSRVYVGRSVPVSVRGVINFGDARINVNAAASVRWCTPSRTGGFLAGLAFTRPQTTGRQEASSEQVAPEDPGEPPGGIDHYEVLQLSPKAEPETIQRVFRILAQRYHPDNPDSGHADTYRLVLGAYQVLSDPGKRAAFDAKRSAGREMRWRILESVQSMQGAESERRKRRGILSLLYARRMDAPSDPAFGIREMEDLLGVPREHLEFSLWYLQERGHLARVGDARYLITVSGVDEVEANLDEEARSDRTPLPPDNKRPEVGRSPAAPR